MKRDTVKSGSDGFQGTQHATTKNINDKGTSFELIDQNEDNLNVRVSSGILIRHQCDSQRGHDGRDTDGPTNKKQLLRCDVTSKK